MKSWRLQIKEVLESMSHAQRAREFQWLAVHLAQTKWPELEATQEEADGGEDATSFFVGKDGKRRSLASSLTGTLQKIRDDAETQRKRSVELDCLVFVTAARVTNRMIANWRKAIRKEFRHDLHVIPQAEIITMLEKPNNAWLCSRYLGLDASSKESKQASVRLRQLAVSTNSTFYVPALDVRLPIEHVWDALWSFEVAAQSGEGSTSLAEQIKHYYEWARLGKSDWNRSRFSALALLKTGTRAVIIGGPGSGKSTLARKLAWTVATRKQSVWRVSLRTVMQLVARGETFVRALETSALHGVGITNGNQPALNSPDFLLADGLDETEPNRILIAGGLRDWALANPESGVVVTTRPVGHSASLLPDFTQAELLPLGESDAEAIARRLLSAVESSTERIEQLIQPFRAKSTRPQPTDKAFSLAKRSPLLLTFLVALHRDGKSLSSRRADLYDDVLKLILESPVNDRQVEQPFSVATLQRGIDALAWIVSNNPGLQRDAALRAVAASLRVQSAASDLSAEEIAERILSFWEQHRLLETLRLGLREAVAFVHPSIAEYCSARHLARFEDITLNDWIVAHRREPVWRETVLLACGCGAAERIIPRLVELDTDDVCSTDAIVAAACIPESDKPAAKDVKAVIERLSAKLRSSIPLICVEAAESLCAIAPVAADICCAAAKPLLNHSQAWTRLGARTIALVASPASLQADNVEAWIFDDSAEPGPELFGPQFWKDVPHEAHELRVRLVELGLTQLLREQPKEYSLELAEKFLGQKHITSGEMFAAEEVLSRLGFQEIVTKRHATLWQSMESFRNTNWRAVDENRRSLCRIVLAATGHKESKVEQPPGFRPTAFGELFHVLSIWEAPAEILTALGFDEERASAIEVLRGAIVAGGLRESDLARDANIILQSDVPLSLMIFGNGPQSGSEPDWKRAARMRLDSKLIARAFLHPSDCVQWTAARLIWGGVAKKEAPALVRSLFLECSGNSLHYVSSIAGILWGGKVYEVLIERLHNGPRRGLRHVCRALGKLGQNETAEQELTQLLFDGDPEIALGAAEGLRAMNIRGTPSFTKTMRRALAHWNETEIRCNRCNVAVEKGSCPKCHVVPTTPHGEVVRILAAIGALKTDRLLELCEDNWWSVKDAAVETLTDWGKEDVRLLRALLRRYADKGGPIKLLEALLKLPREILTSVVPELLRLAQSPNRVVRIQFFEAIASLPLDKVDTQRLTTDGISDGEAAVRNAAVRSLRMLSSNMSQL